MKYLGGKNKIGKYIANILKEVKPDEVNGYMEPFCGSLGVLVHMTGDYKKVYASDTHSDLIALWKVVQKDQFTAPKKVTEEYYNIVKGKKSPNPLKAFVGFGLSFGGRYFGGYAQKYTNGKKEDYLSAATNSMRKIKPLIKEVKFRCVSYSSLKPKKKLIYCDPPYKSKKFPVKYRKNKKYYDEFDTDKFWNTMRRWSKDNFVFVSETQAPSDFVCIWKKKRYRSISQSKRTRYKSPSTKKFNTEKIFVHNSRQDIIDRFK